MTMTQARDANINIRARSEQKALIDRASNILGKSRSDFMLDLACKEAVDVVLDQRVIYMSPEHYSDLLDMLDAPPQDNPKLRELLSTPSPWGED